jgi:hypothetical protein
MNTKHIILAGAFMALALPTAKSQYGTLSGGPYPINLTGLSGGLQCYGVCRTINAAGVVRTWVSARAPAVGLPHRLLEINAGGALVAVHNQPTVRTAANPIGIRDLAWGGGAVIYGGQEVAVANQIHVFDINALAWVAPIMLAGAAPPPVLQALVALPGGGFLTANGGANYAPITAAGVVGAPLASGFADITGAGFDPVGNRLFWFSNGAAGIDYDAVRMWGVVIADARYCGGAYNFMGNVTYGNGALAGAGGFLGGRSSGMDVDRLTGGGALRGLLVQRGFNDWLVEVNLEINHGVMCANCGPICGVASPPFVQMSGATGFVSPSAAFQVGLRNANCAAGGVAGFYFDAGVAAMCPFLLVGGGPFFIGAAAIGGGGTANIAFPIPAGLPVPMPIAFQAFAVPPGGGMVPSRAAFAEIR